MLTPTLETLVASVIVLAMFLLVAFPIHEFAHAFAAFQLGDGTARLMGRLTIDPRAHFDPTGALLLAISLLAFGGGIGWAKPTPYNPMNLRGGRWGEAIVSVAGPISNLILAIAAAIPLRYIYATGMVADVPLLAGVLYIFIQINLLLMVFNLIPIPPLDGSKVLYAFLDPRTSWQVRAFLEQYGLIILIGAIFLPIFGGNTLIGLVFRQVFNPLMGLLIGSSVSPI
jgi:Zn-dependent protease